MAEEEEKKEVEQKASVSDKELNFRQLESKYQRELENERRARQEAEKRALEALNRTKPIDEEEDDDDEPYVDKKRLAKQLERFGRKTQETTKSEINKAVQEALSNERKNNWLKKNDDFYDVLQHADKLMIKDPELAEAILELPEGFERQKLVYKNIKALNLHKPPEEKNEIQNKIDQNRRSPYYQPSGISNSPYVSQGDFSPSGQKEAYRKMQELKKSFGLR